MSEGVIGTEGEVRVKEQETGDEQQTDRVEFLLNERKDPLWLLKAYFQQVKLVALGEVHNSPAMENFLRNSLWVLKASGLTDLVMEEYEEYQPEVDAFMESGEMSPRLVEYLTQGFIRNDAHHNLRVRLLQEARRLGLKVHFIDPGNIPDREQYLTNKISPLMNQEEAKILMVYGNLHVAKGNLPTAGGTMVLGRLDGLYPGTTKSVMRLSDKRHGGYIDRMIYDDTRAAQLDQSSFAIEVSNSPYANEPIVDPKKMASPKIGALVDAFIYHSGDVVLPRPAQVKQV